MQKYYYNDENNFIVEDYQKAKTFSSFLPGIAGEKGIPIWVFYVNRGQGISSFGIENKDHPIMEFHPANGAYQTVGVNGFRTFIKGTKNPATVYEPFSMDKASQTKMTILKDSFQIEDANADQGIDVTVKYTTLSNLPFGGLVRRTVITNTSSETMTLEVADGMPALLPYGVTNAAYKEMSNLIRSWMEVSEIDSGIPYYKLRSSTKDEAVVSEVNSGYFYVNEHLNDDQVVTVYDPSLIFDYRQDLIEPAGLSEHSIEDLAKVDQVYANKVPCAFQVVKCSLKAGESKTINSLVGYTESHETIANYVKGMDLNQFISTQFEVTRNAVEKIGNEIATTSGNKAYDAYIKQNNLDNVLRGGKPMFFEKEEGEHVYHIYSRKHGDLERDYNFFSLEPSRYSRGNGNYRDVCQNRRNDVILEPKVKDFNVWMFYSLVQADGYNPLSIKGTYFSIEAQMVEGLSAKLERLRLDQKQIEAIIKLVAKPFTPGNLSMRIPQVVKGVHVDHESILLTVMSVSKQNIDVDFGEGFWSDHFTYNLDLVHSYEYMYPDEIESTLFDSFKYKFFNAPYYVVPRTEKYNKVASGSVRQYNAISKKAKEVEQWVTNTEGKVVETNLFNKLMVLSLTKFMNLDAFALGVEMEGDKPGWNDALNGLPGLIGSGMSETVELKRTIDYLMTQVNHYTGRNDFMMLQDIANLFTSIMRIINTTDIDILHESTRISFNLWNELNNAKEAYRYETMYNLSSQHIEVDRGDVLELLSKMSMVLGKGIEKSKTYTDGILPSYFVNEVSSFMETGEMTSHGEPGVKVLGFNNRALPLFLEGPARYMKTIEGRQASELAEKVKASGIYDDQLKMYKTSESIESETMEIGRLRAFTAGWLERESVFLHMTYKYLLSLLESGQYDAYYEACETNLIPLLDPNVYGRSTTENSSFIASSVNPDPSVVGQGFVARLSGSTAEAISMWVKMFIGGRGFSYVEKQLSFEFAPKLSSDYFDENGRISFKLFSDINVTYINEDRKATYGEGKAVVDHIILDGVDTGKSVLNHEDAMKLRAKKIKEVVVYFN